MTANTPRDARRRWLGAMMAAAAAAAAGAATADVAVAAGPESSSTFWTLLSSHVTPALHDLRARRYAQAAQRLAQANALIEADAAARWPFRCYVQPPYAFALLKLGRAPEAALLLRQTLAAQDGIQAGGLARFADVVTGLDARLGLELGRVEYAREVMAAIRSVQAPGTLDELPEDAGALTDLWMLVAQAFDAAGEHEALRRLYVERFAAMAVDRDDPPRLAAREYRLHAFARALWRAALPAEAGDAWARARTANAWRIDRTMRAGAPHAVFAACTLRRRYLSAALLAAQASGRLHEQRHVLLADILATKSAGTRYAGALRTAIARQAPDQAAELAGLEDALARLPAVMTDPRPFLSLVARHDLASSGAARRLGEHAAGFPVPDRNLVEALQARLDGAAAIGFMLVDGADLRDGALPSRRYLRYCVSRGEVQLRLLAGQGAIDRLVRACRADYLGGATVSAAAAELAAGLFEDLPAPVLAAGEWLMEADGMLHLAPFDALPGPEGKPLLETRLLRMITSLAQMPPALAPVAGGEAVIVADPACGAAPVDPAGDHGLRWSSDRVPLASAPALPEAREEARATARALAGLGMRSRIVQGDDATATALQKAGRPAVLHVAAHAVLRGVIDGQDADGGRPDDALDLLLPGREAGLVLSRGGRPDVFLANDLAQLTLEETALVVLSACHGANGDVVAGEGVASLRRAAELAGAHSTVAAIWQVPSAATAALMRDFYDGLGRGENVGAALRAAKRKARERGAPPRAWAGFQHGGADGALGTPG